MVIVVNGNEIEKKGRLQEIITIIRGKDFFKEVTPVKVRETLEELGPTFIKFGQLVASRSNIISSEYTQELTKLRSKVGPMEFSLVLEILEQEYHGKQEEIFATIDGRCIGSASIAQVHKAVLNNGDQVVIKVQKKNIEEKMLADINLFKKAVELLHLERLFSKFISLETLLEDFEKTVKEELDFVKEAINMERFRENQRGIDYVKVPLVYKDLSTSKVLVMEYVEGIEIGETETLQAYGYDLEQISFKLAENYIKQAIDDGFFQADPHQDNFKISNGQITYLDFGMMGELSSASCSSLKNCIRQIVLGNMYEVSGILIQLGQIKEVNRRKLTEDVQRLFDKYANSSLYNIQFKDFFQEFYDLLRVYQIKLPNDLVMLFRGIVVIEGLLRELNPCISLFAVLEENIRNSWELSLDKKKFEKGLIDVYNVGNSFAKLPNELLKFVRSFNDGETKFNIEFRNSNKQVDKFESMLHQLVISLLDVALILGASLIDGDGSLILRNVYLGLAFVLSVWLFIKIYIDHKTKGM